MRQNKLQGYGELGEETGRNCCVQNCRELADGLNGLSLCHQKLSE